MVKLKAGKSVLGKAAKPVAPMGVVLTHRTRCPAWWVFLETEVAMMPAGPKAFWQAVLTQPVIPVDPKVGAAILTDARRWAGWSEDAPPLEVKTLSASEVGDLAANYQAQGQAQVAQAIRRFAQQKR